MADSSKTDIEPNIKAGLMMMVLLMMMLMSLTMMTMMMMMMDKGVFQVGIRASTYVCVRIHNKYTHSCFVYTTMFLCMCMHANCMHISQQNI